MKYLVHLRPSREFSDLVQSYRVMFSSHITKISKNVLHTTLMTIYMNLNDEEKVIHTLEGLTLSKFNVEMENLDLFDENSLVARLRKNHDLTGVHIKVIDALKKYINREENPEFHGDKNRRATYEEYGSPYYAEFYNPHLTIAHVNPEIFGYISFNPDYFKGKGWLVSEFYLSKKESDGWKTVRKLSLKQVEPE